MKNKKNTTVKKIVMTAITVLVLVVSLAFSTNPKEQANLNSIPKASKDNTKTEPEPKHEYFVASGYSYGETAPLVISNVVYINREEKGCNTDFIYEFTKTQFATFVKAYYKIELQNSRLAAIAFPTKDGATAYRRKWIAKENNAILVKDFTVTCE